MGNGILLCFATHTPQSTTNCFIYRVIRITPDGNRNFPAVRVNFHYGFESFDRIKRIPAQLNLELNFLCADSFFAPFASIAVYHQFDEYVGRNNKNI